MNKRRSGLRWLLGAAVFGHLFAVLAFCVWAYTVAVSNVWLIAFCGVNMAFAVFLIVYQVLVARLIRQTIHTGR